MHLRGKRARYPCGVPLKGASHDFPARRVRAFINELGFEHSRWSSRMDQEPASLDLVKEIQRLDPPEVTLKEKPPLAASASNRVGVQTVQGEVR